MKITSTELEYHIRQCQHAAATRGFKDTNHLPLEWRPLAGMKLLMELATGYTIWPSDRKDISNTFIDAYGAYYDAQNQLKYTSVAMEALRTVTR